MPFDPQQYPAGLAQLLTHDEQSELGRGEPHLEVADALAVLDLARAFSPHQGNVKQGSTSNGTGLISGISVEKGTSVE